jgi:molybdopterin synthase sulfur carrier subunit
MPRISFTPNLQRHLSCPPAEVSGTTVGEVLAQVFASNPRARGYILDEHGVLRKHLAVFINGELIQDRVKLSDPVPAEGEVYVLQALSGGASA